MRKRRAQSLFLVCLACLAALPAAAQAPLRIGFIDPALPGPTPRRNAAALAFARTQGGVTRLRPLTAQGWESEAGRPSAPEEFDVLWFHQGDDPNAASLDEAASADLLEYVQNGGVLLLSGAAGLMLNTLGVEPTALRILPPTDAAYVSGVIVAPAHRAHACFAGLDTSKPIVLTSLGGNALADFYGTSGPHGELLAEGNAGLGERPLVEYAVGAGRVLFVGWRLPDFTTATDPYRPNLERLFGNMLRYLAGRNANRATLVPPAGKARYARVLGVPFLRAEAETAFTVPAGAPKSGVVLDPPADSGPVLEAPGAKVREQDLTGSGTVRGTGLTLTAAEHSASRWLERRQAEQAEEERREREQIGGLTILKPTVRLLKAPLKPRVLPDVETSVLLGRSPFMAPGDGKGDITPVYQPVEDGGFRIVDSRRTLNRPIANGQNRVWTGDAPIFRMDTSTGNGAYSADRVFPLWPRADVQSGSVYPCMGTLRVGTRGPGGAVRWFDEMRGTVTTFRPGYTEYRLADPDARWHATLAVAPTRAGHGMILRVEFDRPVPLVWQFGGVWWQQSEANANRVTVANGVARITEPNLPNGVVAAAWDGPEEPKPVAAPFGQQVECESAAPRRTYHIAATWGVASLDMALAGRYAARLDTASTSAWPASRDRLKELWLDCYARPALNPEARLRDVMRAPDAELDAVRSWWDRRRSAFQVRTPDARLDALVNWERCASEYHRQGPGLVLGGQYWIMYSHISTGWYGREWGGDHQSMEECLRLYAAGQREDGFIRWLSPSLFAFDAEDNTPYWVDQVWRHYTWTGDRAFLRDMWPVVRKAVAWLLRTNDPDGDGLFQDWYEYWNCDSNGKGPKAAAPSAMAWAALDRAARMAAVLGDAKAANQYQALADRTRKGILAELWREDRGRLGSIGADGIWRGHPQTWEEYLAINAGVLPPDKGRRAMRWLLDHYSLHPKPDVDLLACSDWWPLRWSNQWVPTGDTLLAALAGMKCGDVDRWWPYVRTVVGSAFRSDFPGINMGISNAGAGGGDREDVDSTDPHVHMAVRGLFGIEPALHEGRVDIAPAFPAGWKRASIRTPDVSYEYRREGSRAILIIDSPRPLVKRVRLRVSDPWTVTRREARSVVRLAIPAVPRSLEGGAPSPPSAARAGSSRFAARGPQPRGRMLGAIPPQTILAEQQPPTQADTGAPLAPGEKRRLTLFDLGTAFNVTSEQMTAMRFGYDYAGNSVLPWTGPLQSVEGWWGNPGLRMPPAPRVVESPQGVLFLTAGRARPGTALPPHNLLALSSWQPYPLPGGAVMPVGLRCERVWLLLQSYVHPMKNYIPNGEVVLHYDRGKEETVSLVPPFNLDCYFQHFSRQGVPVPMGRLGASAFVHPGLLFAHADQLLLKCDPSRRLESIELRATVSEGVIGLAGVTALPAR